VMYTYSSLSVKKYSIEPIRSSASDLLWAWTALCCSGCIFMLSVIVTTQICRPNTGTVDTF
jgi:hypothetical protein